MGLGVLKLSKSSFSDSSEKVVWKEVVIEKELQRPTLPNPNPNNYKIIRSRTIGKYLLVFVNYPDCTNYEGNKIMLFENVTIEQLLFQKLIDPHFSDNKDYYSPIARFEPTEKGWNMAIRFITLI